MLALEATVREKSNLEKLRSTDYVIQRVHPHSIFKSNSRQIRGKFFEKFPNFSEFVAAKNINELLKKLNREEAVNYRLDDSEWIMLTDYIILNKAVGSLKFFTYRFVNVIKNVTLYMIH